MSSLDYKQLSHIAAEILLFGGISFYLHSRCNILQNRINEDREKIVSHESRIEELEKQVKQLSSLVQMMTAPPMPFPMPRMMPTARPSMPKPAAPAKPPKVETPPPAEEIPIIIKQNSAPDVSQFFRSGDSAAGVFSNDDIDSIDAELKDELAELAEDSNAQN
jgi:hypothetical protein